jgi:3-dehydroquinate dehydratase
LTSGSFSIDHIPAIEKLEKTMVEIHQSNGRQSAAMVRLTWAIAILTFVMVVGVGVQIWIALQ